MPEKQIPVQAVDTPEVEIDVAQTHLLQTVADNRRLTGSNFEQHAQGQLHDRERVLDADWAGVQEAAARLELKKAQKQAQKRSSGGWLGRIISGR